MIVTKNIRKEGIVLFNDDLYTFYLWLYGVRHNMVKDHSKSERGNQWGTFRLAARFLLYASSHIQDNTYQSLRTTKGSVNALMKLAGFSTSNTVKNHCFS